MRGASEFEPGSEQVCPQGTPLLWFADNEAHCCSRQNPNPNRTPTSRAGGTRGNAATETLEAGAVGMARAHLAVMLARPLLEGAALYPAAMARPYLPYISPIIIISPSTPRQWRASVWRKSKPPTGPARPSRLCHRPRLAVGPVACGWPWLEAARAWPHLAQAGALAGLLAAGDGPAEAELRI